MADSVDEEVDAEAVVEETVVDLVVAVEDEVSKPTASTLSKLTYLPYFFY